MRSYSDRGFIINKRKFREADKLIIVLCEKNGRVEAVAKGAGKSRSRKGGSLDLLNLANFSFHKTKGLDLLVEAELIDDYCELKRDLSSVSEIFYLLEIIDRFHIQDDTDYVFSEFLRFITLFQEGIAEKSVLISGFEIKILDYIGFKPLLKDCIHCKDQLGIGKQRYAAFGGEVGYICKKHVDTTAFKVKKVTDRVVKIQKYMIENELAELKRLKLDQSTQSRLRAVQKSWLEGILENKLKSTKFLRTILNQGKRYK